MADLRKFLDQSGVSTLWTTIGEKINTQILAEETRAKKAEEANANAAAAAQAAAEAADTKATNITNYVGTFTHDTAKNVIEYINAKTTGIATNAALEELQTAVNGHGTAIDVLDGRIDNLEAINHELYATKTQVELDIAAAEVRAASDAQTKADKVKADLLGWTADNLNESYDTLKEIADWIESDTTGAAGMASDIASLKGLVGETSVSDQIDAKIQAQDLSQYVTGTELATELAPYAKTADMTTELGKKADVTTVNGIDGRVAAVEADYLKAADKTELSGAIATAKTDAATDATNKANAAQAAAEKTAKEYADGLASNYATAAQGRLADAAVREVVITENAAGVMQASVNTGGNTVVYDLFAALTTDEINAIINGTAQA